MILFFGIGPAKISPIYPPAGIAVAAVSARAAHSACGLFGQFLNGFPLFAARTTLKMYTLANSAPASADAGRPDLRRCAAVFTGTWHPFDRSRHVVVFLLGSSLAAALLGGLIGSLSL